MTDLTMTFACGDYDRMEALMRGEIAPEGIDLQFDAIQAPREIFDRRQNGCETIKEIFIGSRKGSLNPHLSVNPCEQVFQDTRLGSNSNCDFKKKTKGFSPMTAYCTSRKHP